MLLSENAPAVYAMLHPFSRILLQRVRPTFYLILTNHVFLPHAKHMHAFAATLLIVSIESGLTVYSRIHSDCER